MLLARLLQCQQLVPVLVQYLSALEVHFKLLHLQLLFPFVLALQDELVDHEDNAENDQ